jgi:hypothetical protein
MSMDEEPLTTCISEAAFQLLEKLDYPCSEEVLASAVRIDGEGVQLSGSKADFESLAGWVAGDFNHAEPRAKRKLALLGELSDAFEGALDSRAARSW